MAFQDFVTSGMVLGLTGRQTKIHKRTLFLVESVYFASTFSNTVPKLEYSKVWRKIMPNDILITCSLFSPSLSETFSSTKQLFSFLQQEDMDIPTKVIIAGNICTSESQDCTQKASFISELDDFIYDYLADEKKTVILAPGSNDPTSIALPQKPLVRGLFQKCFSISESQFELTTNPCHLTLDGKRILIVSGQNIDDMVKYHTKPRSNFESFDEGELRLIFAQVTLISRHIAPTAPDTLCMSIHFIFLHPSLLSFLLQRSFCHWGRCRCSSRRIHCI